MFKAEIFLKENTRWEKTDRPYLERSLNDVCVSVFTVCFSSTISTLTSLRKRLTSGRWFRRHPEQDRNSPWTSAEMTEIRRTAHNNINRQHRPITVDIAVLHLMVEFANWGAAEVMFLVRSEDEARCQIHMFQTNFKIEHVPRGKVCVVYDGIWKNSNFGKTTP